MDKKPKKGALLCASRELQKTSGQSAKKKRTQREARANTIKEKHVKRVRKKGSPHLGWGGQRDPSLVTEEFSLHRKKDSGGGQPGGVARDVSTSVYTPPMVCRGGRKY